MRKKQKDKKAVLFVEEGNRTARQNEARQSQQLSWQHSNNKQMGRDLANINDTRGMYAARIYGSVNNIKIKNIPAVRSNIFFKTHLCILRSRVLRVVYPHLGHRSATPPATTAVYVAIRVNRVILVSLCAETMKPNIILYWGF